MSAPKVLRLDDYRGRREQRLRRALALHGAAPARSSVLEHLAEAIPVVGGDRAAALWIDEYGPGLAHPFVVLDLVDDRPRRAFSVEFLKRTWNDGVPGVLDLPDIDAPHPFQDGPRSHVSVSLGSDGMRAWFLVVDGGTPRGPLSEARTEELMFLAGECSSILLHRDLDAPEPHRDGADRFAGWPVLKDVEGQEDDAEMSRRVACRFLVARAVLHLLEDDLVVEDETLRHQIDGVRAEMEDGPPDRHEGPLWEAVLESMEDRDWSELCRRIVDLAENVEDQGHYRGAVELYRAAYEVSVAALRPDVAVEATRRAARASRRMAEWERAVHWYEVARGLAVSERDSGREALILDGRASVEIGRGNLPAAQKILERAADAARRADDRTVMGSVLFSRMTVANRAGDADAAARYGWLGYQICGSDKQRLRMLTALGGVLVEAGELEAAEDAFAIVAARSAEQYYRLYALHGLAYVAAFLQGRAEFERRLERLEEAGFSEGAPEFRAEAFLERGRAYRHLGDPREARRWYARAVAFSEEHDLFEYLMKAEAALQELEASGELDSGSPMPPETPASSLAPSTELDEIRGGLGEIRRSLAACGPERR